MEKLQMFELMANKPEAWFGNADTLLKSAALIWPERRRIPHSVWVALMLRGYAIEDLLKGLWLQAGNSLSINGQFQGVPVPEHDLLALYEKLGNSPGQARQDMLRSLKTAMKHLGRYPIPKKPEQFPVHTESEPDPTALWCPIYEADFWMLVRELGSQFQFLSHLRAGFLERVMEDTWRRPPT